MNIAFIGGHYDDIEIAAGGTVFKYTEKCYPVIAVVTTSSDYTKYDGTVIRSKEQAEKEGKEALSALGVQTCYNLGFSTKDAPYCHEMVEEINRILDEENIDIIYTHHINDTHPSHSNTAKSVISAARYKNNIMMWEPTYPSNVAYRSSFKPLIYVDITSSFDKKVASLQAHKGELEQHPFWMDLIQSVNRGRGIEIGCKYAEAFEPLKWELTELKF